EQVEPMLFSKLFAVLFDFILDYLCCLHLTVLGVHHFCILEIHHFVLDSLQLLFKGCLLVGCQCLIAHPAFIRPHFCSILLFQLFHLCLQLLSLTLKSIHFGFIEVKFCSDAVKCIEGNFHSFRRNGIHHCWFFRFLLFFFCTFGFTGNKG